MYILQNFYSRNVKLRDEVSRIIDLLRTHHIDLASMYINTAENVLADNLSRAVDEQRIELDEKCM